MRVLIAEDDPVSRRILQARLLDWKYEVVAVGDGIQAFETLARDDAPRLALIDWMMPLKDGPEVCRELRAASPKRYTYLILLTSRGDKSDIAEGIEAGADDYVVKPVDAIELRARLLAGCRIIELHDQVFEAQEKLLQQATHDSLTGLLNRTAILDRLEIEIQRARREAAPLTVMMADVDQFKQINDTHGHQIGDLILRLAAQGMASAVRIYDAIGRYGGDEFLIVAPGCDSPTAEKLSQRLHAEIRRNMKEAAPDIMVTSSFGLVTDVSGRMDSAELIRAADKALYEAKSKGRDRTEMWH
jgi:diguanylate cyclase (GGDEF)-like protein